MMMFRFSWCLSLGSLSLLLLVAGCGPGSRTDCNDGVDNDGDGFIDDDDPGCSVNDGFEFPDPVQCSDGFDNDGDGLVDDADFGCESASDPDEEDPIRACNDGADNDGDGLIDFPQDSGCENPVDDDEFNPAQCQDTVDNDSDGRIDFPNDPGCTAPEDDDETTPTPLPACADGIDNDEDDLTDFPQDPGCGSAADEDEFNVIAGACGPIVQIVDISPTGEATGTIDGPLPNELSSPVCNGFGGEFAYTYSVLDGPKALVISTDYPETTLDTVVYVRTECRNPDTELDCDDDGGVVEQGSSHLILPDVPTGTYYVIVDAFGPGSQGNFKVTVTEHAGLGAECDPGDPDACVDGLICREFTPGAGFTCEHHVCEDEFDNDGDGIIDFPDEPGCTGPLDADETDPSPLPECANGVDDDGDTLVDYPDDPGCKFAADDAEIDECIPGIEVISHSGGAVSAVTSGSSSFTAPGGCGFNTHLAPEDVYVYNNMWDLVSLKFTTVGSTLDTVLYVRVSDCATPGAAVACNDNTVGVTSEVTISSPINDYYFAFVDGKTSAGGSYTLNVTGRIAGGSACDPADPNFTCEAGYACDTDTCVETECNDGIDNDGDTLADELDPGCASISDDDETDPSPLPECGNGIDDDGDTLIDYPADPGCLRAGDDAEIDECIPGVDVIAHPGGTLSGTTVGGTSSLTAPSGCGFGTGTSPERVYIFNNTRTLDQLVFDTFGSALDTVLYVRQGDCGVAGPLAMCNDNAFGTNSRVIINSPIMDGYFAIVDGNSTLGGAFDITVSGTISPGGACDAGDSFFVCSFGHVCEGSVCVQTDCNDGVDNDGDGLADDFDPGCDDIGDNDETDPATPPQCANGIDDDGDTFVDYPDDPDCKNAADDDEEQTPFLAADGKSGTAGNLYEVDPATGATTVIGVIGFPLTGLAVCPDGSVYGSQGGSAPGNDLLSIDPDTGAGASIGPTGLFAIPDITCLPDGRLLGWTESGDQAIEFDTATGAPTTLGPGTGSAGSGMASDDTGTVYFVPIGCGSSLYTINTTTGAPTVVSAMSGCTASTINSMTFFDGQLYAVDANRGVGGSSQLGTVNTTTGVFTPIGPLPTGIDAIGSSF